MDEVTRILVLALDFPPVPGGISRYLGEIAKHMPPEILRVIGLPTPGYRDFDAQKNYSVQRLGLPSQWSPFRRSLKYIAPLYLWRLIRERKVRTVLCGQAHYSLMLPAWTYERMTGVPYVVFAYGFDLLHPQIRIYRRPFNSMLKSATTVITISRPVEKIAVGLGVRTDKIQLVRPNIDPATLASSITSETILHKHALHGSKCILTVGRLVERKGHDTVIRALPKIRDAVPDIHYLIAGTGPNERTLKTLAEDLGLSKNVTFAGYVSENELAAYYQACDVFVMISRELPDKGDIEGFGIVYLEANLFGKPVVAGRSGGVTDAVIHERTGLLVDPYEPEEVANAVVRLLINPGLASELGGTGRKRVLNEFSDGAAAQLVLSSLPR